LKFGSNPQDRQNPKSSGHLVPLRKAKGNRKRASLRISHEPRALRRARRHREAALAAEAIQCSIRDLALDCFALLAMTASYVSAYGPRSGARNDDDPNKRTML